MFSLLIHCYNVKNIKKALYWDLCKPSVFGPLLVVMATVAEPDLISSVRICNDQNFVIKRTFYLILLYLGRYDKYKSVFRTISTTVLFLFAFHLLVSSPNLWSTGCPFAIPVGPFLQSCGHLYWAEK